MSRIGILGGTFNPIHIGHLELAKAAIKEVYLDKLLVMPSGVSYLKKDQIIPDSDIRLKLCETAIDGLDNIFEISDLEVKRTGNTYTYETILELKKIYPNDEIYFIIGADSLYYIKNWVKVSEIFDNCTIIAARRGEYSEDEDIRFKKVAEELILTFNAKIILLNTIITDISSTKIRKMFADNTDETEILKYLPQKEYLYIINNNIY